MKTYQHLLIHKKLYQAILILFGLLMFTAFIWLRFIRPRLPKVIPLNLSLLGFCILLYVCCIFLYIVISLLKKPKPVDPLIKQMIDSIYMPLKALDHFIKNLAYTNNTYKYGINFLAYLLSPLIIDSRIFYYLCVIMPRLVLLTALYIDVFWFHKLYYIYKVLLIGIFIVLGKYIIYSFKYAKEHFIESFKHFVIPTMETSLALQILDPVPDEDDYEDAPTLPIPFPEFIEFQTYAYIRNKSYYDYFPFLRIRSDTYYKENNIIFKKFTYEEISNRITNILKISLILAHYDMHHSNNKEIKNLKIVIYLNYLLCWSYILMVSLPSLYNASFYELWIIFNIHDLIEPFSNINIK